MQQAMQAPEPELNACPKCGAAGEMIRETVTLANTKQFRCMSCGEEWTG
jgi:uncharacterized Zn finger protein